MIFPRQPLRTLCLPAVFALLTACTGLLPAAPSPTPSLPPATQTPTIAWFPATNTPTAFPTPLLPPTPESLPGIGDLLFADDFSNASLWNTASAGQASARVANNRLTLSLDSGPLSIASLRSEPLLDDFYAEATASLSLCRGRDQFGLLFRAAPGESYYRFVLTCEGNLRFERVRGGATDIMKNWTPSGDAPLGAPAEVRIGIWAAGAELRFLLNGRFQFSLRDPVLRSGTLGFFARTDGNTPVIVSFSDLQVYSVFYVSPTPSLTPSPTATPTRPAP